MNILVHWHCLRINEDYRNKASEQKTNSVALSPRANYTRPNSCISINRLSHTLNDSVFSFDIK
jgi:hypothetical protein